MTPALQVPGWQWVALVLTAVVVLGAGWPFHRAAAVNLRHGAATMDTLVSIGILAALGWSVYALTGPAGALGYTHAFAFRLERHAGTAEPYLEVAAAITAVPAGRTLVGGAGHGDVPGRRSARCWRSAPARRGCCATAAR